MKTLRQRLLITLLVWLAVVLAVFSTVVYLQVRQTLQGDIDQYVRDKAYLYGSQVNPWYPAGMAVDEKPWRSDRYISYGQIFDTNWNVLIRSTRLSDPIVPTEELKRLAAHLIGVVHHDAVGPDGARYRMATVRIERQGKFVCYSQVGVLNRERERPLRRVIFWLACCAFAALLLAGLGLDYLIRQWGAPLAALSDTARKVNLGNLGQRLFAPPDAPELAQLAATFNELLDRLEAAQASQHRFVADASHELRTPLAALRAEIEVSLRRERTPADYQRTLDSNRHELERFSSLVENLLALAALEAVHPQREKSPVDLALVCRDVAEQLSPLAAAQNVRLQLELAEGVTIPGDVFSLERAVRNLVENAIRHTPAGEQILIRAEVQQGEAIVRVIDAGVGIAPEHLPRLFERFYRVDTARNRAHGGAGLGLSIVKAIVEAHGGTVSVESKLGAGSTFTLRLPPEGSAREATSQAPTPKASSGGDVGQASSLTVRAASLPPVPSSRVQIREHEHGAGMPREPSGKDA